MNTDYHDAMVDPGPDEEPPKLVEDALKEIYNGFVDVEEFTNAAVINIAILKLNSLKNALEAVWEMTEGYADGTPDASAHDHLALKVSSVVGTVLGKYR